MKGQQTFRAARHFLTFHNKHKTSQAGYTRGNIMLITIYDSSHSSLHTVTSLQKVTRSGVKRKSSTAISSSALHRISAAALQNDMQVTAYCAIKL